MIARLRERLRKIRPLAVATAVAAVALIAVGALTAALISLSTAHATERRQGDDAVAAKKLAQCVNNVLGERQKINDSPALIEQANANAAWAQAIVAAVGVPKGAAPAVRAAAARRFVAAVNDYARTSAEVQRTLAVHQRERAAHPLGNC